MKKIPLGLFAFIIVHSSIAQNQSDGNTPLIPVLLHLPSKENKCKDDLLAFYLPCASDKLVIVKNVARLQFSGACRHEVVFDPPVLDVPALLATSNKTVMARYDGRSIPASIIMVNIARKMTDNVLSNKIELGLTNVINNWRQKIFQNGLANSLNGALTVCSISGPKIPNVKITAEIRNLVCSEDKANCVVGTTKVIGEARWTNSISCRLPVFGIPYVSVLTANVSGTANGLINLDEQTNCIVSNLCKPIDLTASINGSIIGTLVEIGMVTDLKVVAEGLHIDGELCAFPLPVTGCTKIKMGNLKIVGIVKSLWGLTSNKVDYVVYDGYTSPSFCF